MKRATATATPSDQRSTNNDQRSTPGEPRLSNTERNEMKKLEKEIAQAEARKAEILEAFNDPNLAAEAMAKLSDELGKLQEALETKEMRWLELADR
jgi:ATP-binding cassette subfamily F protein uup